MFYAMHTFVEKSDTLVATTALAALILSSSVNGYWSWSLPLGYGGSRFCESRGLKLVSMVSMSDDAEEDNGEMEDCGIGNKDSKSSASLSSSVVKGDKGGSAMPDNGHKGKANA